MSLYGIIADLRREYPTADAQKTLDLVVAELGNTRDNLRQALANLDDRALPPGGKQILDELLRRAEAAGVDDLQLGPAPDEMPVEEPLEESEIGIALLLGASSLVMVALAAIAVGVVIYQHS